MKLKRLLSLVMLCLVGISGAWAYSDGQDITSKVQGSWTGNTGNYDGGVERYSGTSNIPAGKAIYQTTSVLESAGYYEVQFYAAASFSDWDENKNKGIVLGEGYAQAYLNDAVYDINVFTRRSCTLGSDANLVTLTVYAEANSTLEFGIKNKDAAGNWYTAKLKSIIYKGAKATSTNSIDVTMTYIKNPSFESGTTTGWAYETSSDHGAKSATNDTYKMTNSKGDYLFNIWWKGNPITQTIGNLPAGKYELSAVVASDGATIYLINGDNSNDYAYIETGGSYPSNGVGQTLSKQFLLSSDASNYKIGVVGGDNGTAGVHKNYRADGYWWYKCDNFQLTYYGNGVEHYATALNGTTAKDGWASYTINVAGNYKITSSAAATIKYTQDGTLEASAVTTFVNLAAGASSENIHLEPGILYLSPNAASTITIDADNKTYTVGSATVNKEYAQPGQTVTVTYADAETNDGTASLGLNGTPTITFGSETVTATATANGFTFVVPNVAAGADYTLSIPANAFGYAVGSTYNEAQNITIKTPAIYDGTYYFKNSQSQKYLSRGMDYGTEAIVDDFGLATILRTDANGNTTFQFFDNQLYLGNQGWVYGDFGTPMKFLAGATDGGFEFRNMDTSNPTAEFLAQVKENKVVNDGRKNDNLYGTSNVWTIETVEQHKANYTYLANSQASVAATNAGIDGITTAESLATEIAEYAIKNVAITGAKAEKYQEYASDAKNLKENEYYTETVTNLIPGLYKLTVDAFQRAAWNDWVFDNGGARGLIYLYANDAKTQLKSVSEYAVNNAYTEGWNPDYEYGGKHYPNALGVAYAALETGNYQNVVYVYVPADADKTTGTLTFGINNPVRQANGDAGKTGTWCVYNNWKLTYYSATPFDETVNDVHYYYGAWTDENVDLTNDVPTLDVTSATGSFNVTATNANGLVYTNGATINGGMTNNIVSNGTCTNLVLTHNGGNFKAHKNFKAGTASYNMPETAIAGDKFGTLMLPFAATTMPDGNKVYALDKGVTFGENIDATETAFKENTPLLVTKFGTYSANGASIAATNDTYTNGELVGTYVATPAPVNSYVLQKHDSRVAFFLVGNSVQPTVNPFRAYIKAQSNGAAPRFININFGDTDGIEAVHSSQCTVQSCYNLAGQRVNAGMGRGIMIINGKKVVK